MFRRVAILMLAAVSWASHASTPDLPRLNGNVTIDGVMDENAWRDALQVELEYENDPGENTAAPVSTVAYLTEDGKNLFVAFVANDPEPDRIRAWLRDRDSFGGGDFVGISLDTYDDGRRAFEFFVNPLGVQFDRTHDDVQKRGDSSWDALWESAGKIVTNGYVVEMRIPLSQLRFQDVDGKQTWGYRVVRKYPRDRDVSMSNMAKDRDRNCKLCQYPKFEGFEGSKPGKNLEIVPTFIAAQVSSSEDPGTSPLVREDTNAEAGVTVRYGITPEITANLAINPDFSQIEADGVQLTVNNRFSAYYREKRPFFLEGADFFNTPLQAVYTRSVVDPRVAGKITGKRGANTIGTFVAQDDVTSLLFPRTTGSDRTLLEQPNTVFVGRYSRGLDGGTALGTILTVRDGDDYQNLVGGFDARWRINDRNEFIAQVLQSETEYPFAVAEEFDQPFDNFGGKAFVVQHTFETRDWFTRVGYWEIDDGFRAGAGFVNQAGSGQQEYSFGRKWQADDRWWTRMRLRGAYEAKDRQDGQRLEDTYILQYTLHGPWQSMVDLNMRTGKEFDDGRMYDYERVNFSTRIQPVGGLYLGLSTKFGDEIDFANARLANQQRYYPYMSWSINRHLLLNLSGARVGLETKAGEQIFDAKVIDARLSWQFNIRSSLRLTLQQTEVERNPDEYADEVERKTSDVGRQLLYSWKMNPQTVLYLGYSDAFVDNDDLEALEVQDRSWFMKVGYAWAL